MDDMKAATRVGNYAVRATDSIKHKAGVSAPASWRCASIGMSGDVLPIQRGYPIACRGPELTDVCWDIAGP